MRFLLSFFFGLSLVLQGLPLAQASNLAKDTVSTTATKAPIIVDVRTEREWNAGHHPEAVLIAWQDIVSGIAAQGVAKDQPIILYCRSGNRAGKALKMLEKAGYSQVTNGINLAELPQFLDKYK